MKNSVPCSFHLFLGVFGTETYLMRLSVVKPICSGQKYEREYTSGVNGYNTADKRYVSFVQRTQDQQSRYTYLERGLETCPRARP
jgi:hypothetical protein